MRPGREDDITALRDHGVLPLLATSTDDDLRGLGDLGYEGEQATITVRVQETEEPILHHH